MENVVRNQLRSLIVLLSLPIATDDVIYVDLSLRSVTPPPPTFVYCLPMCLDNNFKACRAFFGGFISSENGGAVVLR